MTPQKKVAIFSALILAPLVIAVVIYLIHYAAQAERKTSASVILGTTTAMTIAEVEKEMGPPAGIEQSESGDQTITGSVYHYPLSDGAMKVVFVNGVIFHAEFVPGAKS
jgi:hypothetical protein